MLIIPDESLAVQRVIANSMSRHTFAIVQPSSFGAQNQELSTGVGVKWKGAYLILTAGHVVEHCPENTLRFFLPAPEIQYMPMVAGGKTISVDLRRPYELEHPNPPIFADEVDLAAILLPPQAGAEQCFFPLDDCATVPAEGAQVGVFGYPKAARIPVGKQYVASPELFFGPFNAAGNGCKHEPIQELEDFEVPYGLAHRANGLSGSGVWYWLSDPVWRPDPRLIGIVRTECVADGVLRCYDIETVIKFFNEKADFILAH